MLNTTQAIKDIDELERKLKKRNIELNTVLDTTASKKQIEIFATQIQDIFSKNGIDISTSEIITSLNQVKKNAEVTANKISKIKFSIDNGKGVSDYQNRITKLKNEFERYGVSTNKAKEETALLSKALSEITKSSPDSKLLSFGEEFEKEFKAVKVSLD